MRIKIERHIIVLIELLIFLVIIFASAGCIYFQKSKRTNTEEKFQYTIPEAAEEIPSSAVTEHNPPKPVRESAENLLTSKNSSEYSLSKYSGWGYRVQVFSSLQQDESEQAAQKVREKIDEKVYVEFDPPYYKVRVGNCKSSDEAEELLNKLKRLGYPEAWIVRARVINEE